MASWFLQTIILSFLKHFTSASFRKHTPKKVRYFKLQTKQKKTPHTVQQCSGCFKTHTNDVRILHYYGISTVLWQDTACSLNSNPVKIGSSALHIKFQFVPHREHSTSPLQRPTVECS